ncbi:MAG: efflux RND transporter periplasmic adaptor subunit [Deltaproteobacteria bacterium]|nr:efflux RND transporter periplasmic adaptor subunit [Deltaproteobacteria bacterium]
MTRNEQTNSGKPLKYRMLKLLWGSLPILVFLLVIVLLGYMVGSKSKALETERKAALKESDSSVNVVTMEMKPKSIRDRINLPGVVEPWVKLKILSEVRGKIIQKIANKGAEVRKGDIIAIIDSRDYENTLISAKASYRAALSSKERIDKLYRQQLATRSQLDDATAMVDMGKARTDSAKLNLDRCTIRSPISGVLNRSYFESGQYMNISDPIAEVLQIDKVKVVIGIPESDVNAVRSVDEYEVKIDALSGKFFQAKKHFLSKSTNSMARLYNLELTIENPSGEILPDMFARVEIIKEVIDNAITLPLFSVITINEENIVYVVKGDIVQSRKIELGMQEGWRVQVTKGLEPNEHVVVVGQRSVNDGQKVNIIKTVSNLEALSG